MVLHTRLLDLDYYLTENLLDRRTSLVDGCIYWYKLVFNLFYFLFECQQQYTYETHIRTQTDIHILHTLRLVTESLLLVILFTFLFFKFFNLVLYLFQFLFQSCF